MDNVVELISWARTYDAKDLLSSCSLWIVDHFGAIFGVLCPKGEAKEEEKKAKEGEQLCLVESIILTSKAEEEQTKHPSGSNNNNNNNNDPLPPFSSTPDGQCVVNEELVKELISAWKRRITEYIQATVVL